MRSARIFNATNWKYALGEVLLIVVGITIALAANSWYEDRRERRDELQVLEQLQQALEIDLDEFESRYTLETRIFRDVSALLEHMQSDAVYDVGIIPYFRSVRRWVGVGTNSAPYEALKSSGFDLISSASLQLALIYYYENQFPRLQGAYLNNRAFAVDRVVPFYLENFRQTEPGTFIPDDYQKLRSDQYFWNLCMTKVSRLQNRSLPRYEESIEMIRGILADIEIALND
jgi:hypothetical protein